LKNSRPRGGEHLRSVGVELAGAGRELWVGDFGGVGGHGILQKEGGEGEQGE
jgi:hypothetical protein